MMECKNCPIQDRCYRLSDIPFDTDPCDCCIHSRSDVCKKCSKNDCEFVMKIEKPKTDSEILEGIISDLRSAQYSPSDVSQSIEEAIKALENKSKYEDLIKEMVCDLINFDCNVCHAIYTCDNKNREKCKRNKINEYKKSFGLEA